MFGELTEQGVFFVTRMKDNADYVVVERRPVSEAERAAGVRADEIVVFCQQATADNRRFFRWVRYWDAEQQREFVFLTNHYTLAPSVVAAVYRERCGEPVLDSSSGCEGGTWVSKVSKKQ